MNGGNTQELVRSLTEPHISSAKRRYALRDFANATGWRPSYEFEDYPGTEAFSNGHIVVEHGLDNAAVISFIKSDYSYQRLVQENKINILLSLSYNNLVEWHLLPDPRGVTFVFNRTNPPTHSYISIHDRADAWRMEAFEQVTGRRPNPNVQRLDDALINSLSHYKRLLAVELGAQITTDQISSLFNCLIFTRAVEDYRKRSGSQTRPMLLHYWGSNGKRSRTLQGCIKESLRELGVKNIPASILDLSVLSAFDNLDRGTTEQLLTAFYFPQAIPYQYDFSVMSKHALSRIYEKYVSLLRPRESPQLSFWQEIGDELDNKQVGGYYTPQYIARFFARFLKENHTPPVFRGLKIADPACGSGIFLRTTLEMQCDPFQEINTQVPTEEAFANVFGIDIDPNACHATRLSLALLYLVLMGKLPSSLKIYNDNSISYFIKHPILRSSYDAVIANPPFIKWDTMDERQKKTVSDFMGEGSKGKIDMSLALVKIGMEMVKPGGLLLYVLPHSFLSAENSKMLRKEISTDFWIKVLVDLSEIPVFENVGAYVVLLVIQKKLSNQEEPGARVVRCRESVGRALQEALEITKNDIFSPSYDIYDLPQKHFLQDQWSVLSPIQIGFDERLAKFSRLDDFLVIREGMVTGADEVFIIDKRHVPKGEESIFKPLLTDREMQKFSIHQSVTKVVFYPYLKNQRLTETQLKKDFPATWKYLQKNYDQLSSRLAVSRHSNPWWCPVRPRPPENMLRPKIVSPHLVMFPRFSLDISGNYAVSRCPLLYPRESGDEITFLKYFLAVLNSSVVFWQLAHLSPKYSHGYLMLEPKNLKKVSVPDPAKVPVSDMKKIQNLVDKCISHIDQEKSEQQLDFLIADLYGLNGKERREIGLED